MIIQQLQIHPKVLYAVLWVENDFCVKTVFFLVISGCLTGDDEIQNKSVEFLQLLKINIRYNFN